MSDEYCILETQLKSLPDHWTSIGVTTNQLRVMETFDTAQEAKTYIEENYGMYADDAQVARTDKYDIMWGDD